MSGDITELLQRARTGDQAAAESLFDRVYTELYRIADAVSPNRAGSTLSPTALVHEAFVRMRGAGELQFETRRHFYAFASKVMRNVLIDYARRRDAGKRGPGAVILPLDESRDVAHEDSFDWIEFDAALDALTQHDAELGELAQLRLFGGLSVAESAIEMNLSERTAQRRWRLAKAWLQRALSADDADHAS